MTLQNRDIPAPALSQERAELLDELIAELESSIHSLDSGRLAETAAGLLHIAKYFNYAPLTDLSKNLCHISSQPDFDAEDNLNRASASLRKIIDSLQGSKTPAFLSRATATRWDVALPYPSIRNATPIATPESLAQRFDGGDYDSFLSLTGDLIHFKNQLLGVTRQLDGHPQPHKLAESVSSSAQTLDRLADDLQRGLVRARLQPINHLFDLIQQLPRRRINLQLRGGEAELDRNTLDDLASPLIQLLQHLFDRSINFPEPRLQVVASHLGGYLRITISGNALDSADPVIEVPEHDAIHSSIGALGGTLSIRSAPPGGNLIELLLPQRNAIIAVMLVGIGSRTFAFPLDCISEVVRLTVSTSLDAGPPHAIPTREGAAPLIDVAAALGLQHHECPDRFALVIASGHTRAALAVDELRGNRVLVTASLSDLCAGAGPFSATAIAGDGQVILIIDPAALIQSAPVFSASETAR